MGLTLTKIYHDAIEKMLVHMCDYVDSKSTGIIFTMTERDNHIAERAIERKIDMNGLIGSSLKIVKANNAPLIKAATEDINDIVIKTEFGNLAFRNTWREARHCHDLRLCTITPKTYGHSQSFIIGE